MTLNVLKGRKTEIKPNQTYLFIKEKKFDFNRSKITFSQLFYNLMFSVQLEDISFHQ